jgi:bacteriocin biosynthesis cyclodehydratase domain-containing protein
MTHPPEYDLVLIGLGAFGQGAGHILSTIYKGKVAVLTARTPLRSAKAHMLIAPSAEPDLTEALDALSFERGVPWLPVTIEHPQLRVGPLVVPGEGACARCYLMRHRQHDPSVAISDLMIDHLRRHPGEAPQGHLPGLASVAAALAVKALAGPAGRVVNLDVLSLGVSSGHVTGIHGCGRCDPTPRDKDRTYRMLVRDLQACRDDY